MDGLLSIRTYLCLYLYVVFMSYFVSVPIQVSWCFVFNFWACKLKNIEACLYFHNTYTIFSFDFSRSNLVQVISIQSKYCTHGYVMHVELLLPKN